VGRNCPDHFFRNPVNTQKNIQQTATGPSPKYKNGIRSSRQGLRNAATTAGHKTETAIARRILPESVAAVFCTAACVVACPRLKILGKKKIARIMMTRTRIS
jgi:diphthamide synthase subunit DPH2